MQRLALRVLALRTDSVQEKGQRGVEGCGGPDQGCNGHAVHSALILLDLLESDAQGFAQRPLAQAERLATVSQTFPDNGIDRIRTFSVSAVAPPGLAGVDR